MAALFSRETTDFLFENCLHNDKVWFNEHKQRYNDHVIAPLTSLAEALTPTLLDIDAQLKGSVARIWRDARYAKDNALFRDTMWCMFIRQKNMGLPEFFFVISPDRFLYGGGYYSAGTASMERVRRLILANDKDFQAALAAYESQDTFALEGEIYKRSRHPDTSEKLRHWLDRKTICFVHNSSDFDLLFSSELAATIAAGYKTLAPMYHFLMKAENQT